MGCGSCTTTSFVSALIVAYAAYLRGLVESNFQVLFYFLRGHIFLVVGFVLQFALFYLNPIARALTEILFQERKSCPEVDQFKIDKRIILLVKHTKTLNDASLTHFDLQ